MRKNQLKIFMATVATVDPTGITLIMPGDTAPTPKRYKYNTSAQLAAGNRVLCIRIAGTCVAVCPINGTWTPPSGGGTVYVPAFTAMSPPSRGNRITWSNNGGLPNPPPVEILNGTTPVRGVDYWTQEDRDQIVDDVLAALPKWTGGAF